LNGFLQNGSIGYVYDSVGNRKTLNSTVAAIPAGVMNYDANDRISTDVSDNNGNDLGALDLLLGPGNRQVDFGRDSSVGIRLAGAGWTDHCD
jgi:hypothetical protein